MRQASLFVAALLSVAACGRGEPEPAAAETETVASPASSSSASQGGNRSGAIMPPLKVLDRIFGQAEEILDRANVGRKVRISARVVAHADGRLYLTYVEERPLD